MYLEKTEVKFVYIQTHTITVHELDVTRCSSFSVVALALAAGPSSYAC